MAARDERIARRTAEGDRHHRIGTAMGHEDRQPCVGRRAFGGKVLARGGRYRILEGPEKFQRFVVVEFPSLEQAVACHESPEYQEAAAFRAGGAGEVELVIVDGGDATK